MNRHRVAFVGFWYLAIRAACITHLEACCTSVCRIRRALSLPIVVIASLFLTSTCAWGQASGTFPIEPFNGMQIIYSVSGATLTNTEDRPGFGTCRYLEGTLADDGELHVSGKALWYAGWGYGVTITVTVAVDGQEKSQEYHIKTGGSATQEQDFDFAVPIAATAREGTVRVNMDGDYNVGTRGLTVRGTFKTGREVPAANPTPAAKPTPTAEPVPTEAPRRTEDGRQEPAGNNPINRIAVGGPKAVEAAVASVVAAALALAGLGAAGKRSGRNQQKRAPKPDEVVGHVLHLTRDALTLKGDQPEMLTATLYRVQANGTRTVVPGAQIHVASGDGRLHVQSRPTGGGSIEISVAKVPQAKVQPHEMTSATVAVISSTGRLAATLKIEFHPEGGLTLLISNPAVAVHTLEDSGGEWRTCIPLRLDVWDEKGELTHNRPDMLSRLVVTLNPHGGVRLGRYEERFSCPTNTLDYIDRVLDCGKVRALVDAREGLVCVHTSQLLPEDTEKYYIPLRVQFPGLPPEFYLRETWVAVVPLPRSPNTGTRQQELAKCARVILLLPPDMRPAFTDNFEKLTPFLNNNALAGYRKRWWSQAQDAWFQQFRDAAWEAYKYDWIVEVLEWAKTAGQVAFAGYTAVAWAPAFAASWASGTVAAFVEIAASQVAEDAYSTIQDTCERVLGPMFSSVLGRETRPVSVILQDWSDSVVEKMTASAACFKALSVGTDPGNVADRVKALGGGTISNKELAAFMICMSAGFFAVRFTDEMSQSNDVCGNVVKALKATAQVGAEAAITLLANTHGTQALTPREALRACGAHLGAGVVSHGHDEPKT